MAFLWFTIFFGWASVLLFVVLAAYRFRKFKNMPLPLRWEVYPVPHETKDRRQYGGSYMEEVDWAKKPRRSSLLAELVEMGHEILLLKRVREHNPYHLWPLSLALHWGTYLLVLWVGLLALTNWIPALTFVAAAVGVAALVLGAAGSAGLIVKRATHRDLALYTTPIDYFNLLFLAAIFGLGLVSWLADPLFSGHRAYIGSLLFFRPVPVSPTVTTTFLLLQAFAIYMPLSKLIHYVMKHFTFTETLWDDGFNVKGSAQDQRLARQLSYKVDWAGPHIGRDKTWLEDIRDIDG
jgi:nitrate reductase gamma subunit